MASQLTIVFFTSILALSSAKVIETNHGFGIVGGDDVEIQDVPYQAAIKIEYPFSTYSCGGSVISEHHILTAAHCVYDARASWLTVILGSENRNSKYARYFNVAKITVHEEFNDDTTENDVAILKLARKITFSDKVKIISLAEPGYEVENGTELFATGWGETEENGNGVDYLRIVFIPAISLEECIDDYAGINATLTDNNLCAGEAGQSTCQGDNGGPLVERTDDGVIQVGITSFAVGCARPGYPTVFTKVSAFYDWIQKAIGVDLNEVSDLKRRRI